MFMLPMTMSGFPAKLVVIAALVLLLMADSPATCAILLPHGRDESTIGHGDCRGGLSKLIGRKEGNFGCQSEILSKKTVPIRRSLRPINRPRPPSPTRSPPRYPFLPPRRPHRPPPPPLNDAYSPDRQ